MEGTPAALPEGAWYIGGFRFESSSGRLTHADGEMTLRPKTAAVLAALADRAGEVVAKDALLRAVWPEGYVADAVLAVCVSELRTALGDRARDPRYIATAHRRGYRLVAPVAASPQPTGPPGRPFVGRVPALATLEGWWAGAQQGQRAIGFLAAPAGVGKTAAIDAFVRGLRGRADVLVGWGQCAEPFGEGEPYLPVLEALAGLCRGPGGGRVREVLLRCAPSWLLQLPGLLDAGEAAALRGRVAGAAALRMLREFAVAAEELTRSRPLVLVLEDLHDSDRATVDLVSYLARRREPARLLLLGSYRPAEVIARGHPLHRLVPELAGRGLASHLALELLSPAEVGSYLRARLAPRVPAGDLVADVHERTEGNALFVVAITDDLLARGLLEEREGVARVPGRLATLGLPDEVRLMIERQLDALAEPDRDLLEVASAAGVEFAAAAVAAGLCDGSPAAAVEARLDSLARQGGLLAAAGTAAWPDGTVSGRYRFAHELYRDVLYGRVTPARRVRVHRGIGGRVAAGYRGRLAEVEAELAMHFERGQDYRAAAAQLCAAAETALHRSACPEALRHARRALGLLDHVADSEHRARLELAARRALVAAAATSWDWQDERTGENCLRLRDLARDAGDSRTLAAALLGLHNHAMTRSDLESMRSCSRELDSLARRAADPAVELASDFLQMPADSLAGLCVPVWERARRMLAGYRPADHGDLALLLGDQLDVAAHLYASTALWQLGYPDRAREHASLGLAAARSHEVPAGLARALWFGATVQLLCGAAERVRELAAELAALCARHDLRLWRAGGTVLDGWAAGALGDPAVGLERVRRGIRAWAQIVPAANGFYSRLAAELCLAAGDAAAGLAEVGSALGSAAATGQAQAEPELLRLRGELLLAGGGDQVAAESSMLRAVSVSAQRRARSFELRAVTSLARLRYSQGRVAEARAVLGGVYGWFTEGHGTADLARARAVLAGSGSGEPAELP